MNQSPHPFDLEIQDFDFYRLIIDARSPREYAVDHIPGSKNLYVVDDDGYSQVGTLHRSDTHLAYQLGVAASLQNISRWIASDILALEKKDKILVYCFRGGKRSKLWADNLRTIGYQVDVLRGGWKAYRRWVIASLEVLPRLLDFRVLSGPTGSGKTRILKTLEDAGEQTIDLEGLAKHRGSLIGGLPNTSQPTQKTFDTLLLAKLREFTSDRPVWIEAESKKIGDVQLPASLMEAMEHAKVIQIEASLEVRLQVWMEDFPHFASDPMLLMPKLEHLKPLVGSKKVEQWGVYAAQGLHEALFTDLMVSHYDPAYQKSNERLFKKNEQAPAVHLFSLSTESLASVAGQLMSAEAKDQS
jgi:tRNA 2-selenouridine synthase